MFSKLLKYELKFVGKWYFALNTGLLLIAALLGFVIKSLDTNPQSMNEIIPFFLFLILGALIASTWLATITIIVKRFYSHIFGREGYLTLTLPVSIHQIIISKLLVSVLWSIFNTLVILISIGLLFLPSVGIKETLIFLPSINDVLPFNNLLLLIFYTFMSNISGNLLIYFALSIGQLFSDHRILMSFVAYFSIIIALILFTTPLLEKFMPYDDLFSTPFFIYYILAFVIESSIFYFGTAYIIKNKLNLQ